MTAEEEIVAAYSAAAVAELDIFAELLLVEGGGRFLDLDFRKRKRRKERIDQSDGSI